MSAEDEHEETRREVIKKLVDKHRAVLEDPRMADDYNPETGECDGIPYWERKK